jgi:hypothetical protein
MSLILEALKKSEQQRRLGEADRRAAIVAGEERGRGPILA